MIAGDNQFDQYGYGSISSPANSPGAITVAATTLTGTIADFSSGGPTPVSLKLKPDVSAPGVAITSSLPVNQAGPYGAMSGTSMAAPQVSGAVALLMERHPSWTVAEIKSALVQTGDPVRDEQGHEVSVLREGGGLVDLVKADNPLLFAAPTLDLVPGERRHGARRPRRDAGGGAGELVGLDVAPAAARRASRSASRTASRFPGALTVTAQRRARGAERRRHRASSFSPVTARRGASRSGSRSTIRCSRTEPARTLTQPGIYQATTVGGESKVLRYRYPTTGDGTYPGPEVAYLVHVIEADRELRRRGSLRPRRPARRVRRRREPPRRLHRASDRPQPVPRELRRGAPGRGRRSCRRPAPTRSSSTRAPRAGPGRSRSATGSTTRRRRSCASSRRAAGRSSVAITDAGAGVDPYSIGRRSTAAASGSTFSHGRLVLPAARGRHLLIVTASDYQELKNMEDVAPIKPNTATLRQTVVVR